MNYLFVVVLLVFALSPAFAQSYIAGQTPFTKDALLGGTAVSGITAPESKSLLDPARFSMHQSYSMSYTASGGSSDMTGLYLNRLQYDFQVPVTLQVDVGFFHKPMSLTSNAETLPGRKNSLLTVPRVGFLYQPSKNFSMSFEYINLPGGYGNAMSPYGFLNDDPFFPRASQYAGTKTNKP